MYPRHLILTLAALFLGAILSTSAFGEIKVAVVNVQKAILDSENAQKLLKQIQDEFKVEQDGIRKIETEITSLVERLRKDSEVMSDNQKRKLQQEIETKQSDYRYQGQKLQKRVEGRQQELFSGVDVKVQKAIEELVKADDYDLILPRQGVLYAGDLYDITRKVTEKLNKAK